MDGEVPVARDHGSSLRVSALGGPLPTDGGRVPDWRVLLDLSNLVVGGGVQVGASFVDELNRLTTAGEAPSWLSTAQLEVSRAVADNLTRPAAAVAVRVVDGRPWTRVRRLPRRPEFDVCFTVFGPAYGPRRGVVAITGFADVTSLVPEWSMVTGPRARLRHLVRRTVSRRSFLAADRIVVESPSVASELAVRWSVPVARIATVPNVTHDVFTTREGRREVSVPRTDGLVLAYPTRPYPHKNLAFLGRVAAQLASSGLDVRFVLTLDDAEWQALDPGTRAVSENVGPLLVSQMPALYEQVDGVFFPSLNECSSATILEALSSGRPLVASDRPFVREVAADAAWYVDPLDPAAAAAVVREAFASREERRRRVQAGRSVAAGWPTAEDRARSYLAEVERAIEDLAARGHVPSRSSTGDRAS